MIFGLEFPAIEQLVEWPNAFGDEGVWYGFNKIALINLVALLATSLVFILAARRKTLVDGTLVPRGPRNLIESAVSFIRDGIIMETVGADGLRYSFQWRNIIWMYDDLKEEYNLRMSAQLSGKA